MKTRVAILMLGVVSGAHAQADPFLWLEDVHGERAMKWVEVENDRTRASLDTDPRYGPLFEQAKRLADTDDSLSLPTVMGHYVYNFWQTAAHPHGIWRRTSLELYQKGQPDWHTLIDLDGLSAAEHANWFWKGAGCSEPDEHRCIISLSDGNADAVNLREFDLQAGQFAKNGFSLPTAIQSYAWDDDSLLVAREWSPGELTQPGFPYVVKRLLRSQPLDSAVEVFRGKPEDLQLRVITFGDASGHRITLISTGDTSNSDSYILGPGGPRKLGVPRALDYIGLLDGRLLLSIKEDWTRPGRVTLPQGSVVALELGPLQADPSNPRASLVYTPGPREAFVDARTSHGFLLVGALDNVNGRLYSVKPEGEARWSKQAIPLPEGISAEIVSTDIHSDRAYVAISGFLTPPELLVSDLATATLHSLQKVAPRFDATREVVEQFEARSTDGTHIPYFIVHRAGMKLKADTPTILGAYGGFLTPQTPHYSAELGKLWLEKGNSFVLANIRGGGEFGPRWHAAGLKTHRQRIYDDFAAVGRDLVTRGFTSAAHLGIRGRSNGGLLMGVELTQQPQMWGAVEIQVPMLDMLRFEQIASGSSWVEEFGSVSNPRERAFLASISPYNNLRAHLHYPPVYIWSSTNDDRVGPQHARKFAARLASLGAPYYYYENTEGGHAGAVTPVSKAVAAAREYTFFSRNLGQ